MPKSLKGKLHITSLEAMGPVGCTLHFGDALPEGTTVLREADAISTVTLLDTGRFNKEEMLLIQELHENWQTFTNCGQPHTHSTSTEKSISWQI
jgi:hypothetical protein